MTSLTLMHGGKPPANCSPQPQSSEGGKRSDDSRSFFFPTNECERAFITRIHATNIMSGLRHSATGFHLVVQVGEQITKTTHSPILQGKNEVKWHEEIPLPSERSFAVSFKLYASFGLGTSRGNGALLYRFGTTVGDMLDRNEELQPIRFLDTKVLSSCLSLGIITERRICDVGEYTTRPHPQGLEVVGHPARLTDAGDHALQRYRRFQHQKDLDEAVTCFEHVRDMYSAGHPDRTAALFNLATAKFIHCQDNHDYLGLDSSVALYRDALQLRTRNNDHTDHPITALNLCFTLLVRLQSLNDRADRTRHKDLFSGAAENYAYRVAWVALQMASISVSMKQTKKSGISPAERTESDDKEFIRMMRAKLLHIPERDPHRPALLAGLGTLFCQRFEASGNLAVIHEAISLLESALAITSEADPSMPTLLSNFAESLFSRYERLNDLADLNKSISMHQRAVRLITNDDTKKPGLLNNLGSSLMSRHKRLEDITDVTQAMSMFDKAVRLTPDNHPDKPSRLKNLADSSYRRFACLGNLADIDKSILMSKKGLRFALSGHPDRSARLTDLGEAFLRRFEHFGDLADLDKSIPIFKEAVHLTPIGHLDRLGRLNNFGSSFLHRFRRCGDLADINNAISMLREAVRLTAKSRLDKLAPLSNLGLSLSFRFERLGDLADINESISTHQEALRLVPYGHPDRAHSLSHLGSSLSGRFERLGDLADINESILIHQEAVGLSPGEADPRKQVWLNNLGRSLSRRFERLGDIADINEAIQMFQKAAGLTPTGHPDKPDRLINLGTSLLCRFERLGDLADINKSVLVKEEAVRSAPEDYAAKPDYLNNLGNSLRCRFQRVGDLADINRSVLMFEKANCLTPNDDPRKMARLHNLGAALSCRFERLGDPADISKSILTLEEALHLIPNSHPMRPALCSGLGLSLCVRFRHFGDLLDIDKSILMCEEAVHLMPRGHPDKRAMLNNLGNSLMIRFHRLDNLSDVNKSILLQEEAIDLTPSDHPSRSTLLSNLGLALLRRFERLRDNADIDKSILVSEEAVSLTLISNHIKQTALGYLGISLFRRFACLGDLADIHRSISMLEKALCLIPDGHPDKPALLSDLGASLFSRYERLGDLTDVNRSISMLEEAISTTPDGHPYAPTWLSNLGNAFTVRFKRCRDPCDLSSAIARLEAASRSSAGSTSVRFQAARSWIDSAHLEGNPEALMDAYAATIALLPQLAWLGLPLQERHRILLEVADIARDASAAALETGHPEKAVEWLEQGRSVVWNQLLQLRAPIDELRAKHTNLAHQFQQICQELERASSRDPVVPQEPENNPIVDNRSFEKDVQRHHDLALKREKLLARIRSLPGFEQFLLPKNIEQLISLAHSGPVVYLNASNERCDALIVMAGLKNTILVPLPSINFFKLKFLQIIFRLTLQRNRLIISREDISSFIPPEKNDLAQRLLDYLVLEDSNDRAVKAKPQRIAGYTPDGLFQHILKSLWDEVVKPVLAALGFLTPSSNEKLPRIFWCPTGPFAFLPIHAAGLYDTSEAGAKLSDFAISSYIPTLSALSPSAQNRSIGSSSNIRLISVSQPPTDGLARLASVKEEVDLVRALSAKSPFVTLEDSDGTVEDIMEKMKDADWVHFACHGVQDPHDPLESGLCLADRRRLRLSDIIRLSRPHGGLAFLSACQTAQGDEQLAEESVHLAAGMLLAGYGGVIATMWAIRDPDAPKVAKDVYGHLLRDGKVPESTEAAEALHYAVQHLRDSGAPFTSWVPFIHVGR